MPESSSKPQKRSKQEETKEEVYLPVGGRKKLKKTRRIKKSKLKKTLKK